MLKLELTDGVTSCYAIEFARVPSLSATLKSGTKLSVSNVRVENGYLLLNPSNTFLLGGCASFLVSTNTPSYSRNNELKVSTVRVLAERRRCLKSRQRQNPVDHSFVEKCIAKSVTLPTYYNRRRSLPWFCFRIFDNGRIEGFDKTKRFYGMTPFPQQDITICVHRMNFLSKHIHPETRANISHHFR